MAESRTLEQLMECLIQVLGRATMPEERVRTIVETGTKQIKAFNLADGTLTQVEIAKKAGVDQGSLSRAFARWVENGVAFWIGEGKEARLMHIYAIPITSATRSRKKQRARGKRSGG